MTLGSLFHLNDADSTLAIRVDEAEGQIGVLRLGDRVACLRVPRGEFERHSYAVYSRVSYGFELLSPPRSTRRLFELSDYRNLIGIDERGLCIIAAEEHRIGEACLQISTVDWKVDPLPRLTSMKFIEHWRLYASFAQAEGWLQIAAGDVQRIEVERV